MLFLLSKTGPLSISEAFQVMLLGMSIVFMVLVFLFVLVRVLRAFTEAGAAKKPAAKPQNVTAGEQADNTAPPAQATIAASAGEVALNTLDDKTAALLLAIIANETDIPLERLKVISLRETEISIETKPIEQNERYAFQFRKENGEFMTYNIKLNGKDYEVEVERGEAMVLEVKEADTAQEVQAAVAETPKPAAAQSAPQQGGGTNICSPLPGVILAMKAVPGDIVKAGQILAVIEAMKMENEIPSPRDGKVKAVLTAVGQNINTGDALIVLE